MVIFLDTPNKKYRDTPFRFIFKEPEAFVSFYQDVFGKTLPLSSVEKLDLDSELIQRSLINDVSFIIKDDNGKDRLLVLVEHQSIVNPNMPIRFMIYYCHLLKVYMDKKGMNIHGEKKLDILEPEFIVAYNGAKDFPEPVMPFGMNIPINIVDVNFKNLENKENTSYLAGYAFFIETQERKRAELLAHGSNKKEAHAKAFVFAREESLKQGYIIDVFNRKEFIMTNMDYMDHSLVLAEQFKSEGKREGILEGKREGILKGREETLRLAIKENQPEVVRFLVTRFDISPQRLKVIYEEEGVPYPSAPQGSVDEKPSLEERLRVSKDEAKEQNAQRAADTNKSRDKAQDKRRGDEAL